MAHPALDMGKAWTQATGMLGANRDLVSVLAGLFLFVPLFVVMIALLGAEIDFGAPGSDPDPERVAAQINAVLAANWAPLLLAILGQLAGGIAILALLGDPRRPTVREVLARVPRLLLPMLGAQLLSGVLIQLPSILAGLLPEPGAAVAGFAALAAGLYLTVKFSVVSAVVVIDRQSNPIAATRRSWRMTGGNGLRLFVFYAMLGMVGAVIGLILVLVVGLALSVLGDRAALIGNAAFAALLFSLFYTISYALTAAIHRQLSQEPRDVEADLFE
jgi:hypothetical protein